MIWHIVFLDLLLSLIVELSSIWSTLLTTACFYESSLHMLRLPKTRLSFFFHNESHPNFLQWQPKIIYPTRAPKRYKLKLWNISSVTQHLSLWCKPHPPGAKIPKNQHIKDKYGQHLILPLNFSETKLGSTLVLFLHKTKISE